MRKIIALFFVVKLFASNCSLWIYTDLNSYKLLEELKKEFQRNFSLCGIKILKAPLDVLIKKQQTLKKADIFITGNNKYINSHSALFNGNYKKIRIKKLAMFSLGKKESFLDIKNKKTTIGLVGDENIYKIFMNAVKKAEGKEFFLEIKFFNKRIFFKNSFQCEKALQQGRVGVCVDWATGFWKKKNKLKIEEYLINNKLYKNYYAYAVVTKYSKHPLTAVEFINFINKKTVLNGKEKKPLKTLKFLEPDLPL